MLDIYLSNRPLAVNIDLDALGAKDPKGLSGADIKYLCDRFGHDSLPQERRLRRRRRNHQRSPRPGNPTKPNRR